mgnify:CR=1 FL=1
MDSPSRSPLGRYAGALDFQPGLSLDAVDVVHINPGIFDYIYLLGLPAVRHFGVLMGPFGAGLNAPPSNEDIARVAVGVLAEPVNHIGKSY